MLKKMMMNGIRVMGMLVIGASSVLALNACSDVEKPSVPPVPDGTGVFDNLDSVVVDVETGVIELPEGADSLVISSLASLGGTYFFIATDDDPEDPSFDWENPLDSGSVISLKDNKDVRVVALDKNYRVIKIWTIAKPEDVVEESSSSEDVESSSSKAESSSSEIVESSSSESAEGSSSSENVEESSSSAAAVESSSSAVVEVSSSSIAAASSSSIAVSSSSEGYVSSSSIVESSSGIEVSSSSVDVSSSSAVIVSSSSVVPSSSSQKVSSSSEEISSSSEVVSSSSEAVLSSSSEDVVESSSSVETEGPQLPGSDFSGWDKSFWGSTSDAMAKEDTYAAIKLKSSANAEFSDSKMTLTTREIEGSFIGFEGSWKMAGGFYFAGTFVDTDIVHLYQWNYTSGTPDASYASDISQGMSFGQPFSARPVSFEVTFAYSHVANTNKKFPQQGLIYVALVSSDNKIVAAGSIVKTKSSDMATETIELEYGSDAGLISAEYAGVSDLTVGSGNETVASIRVMFASSAYAFVVDGGALGNSGKYRGGENSKLIVDNFKLNY